ncbi:pyrrolo-quinoline quinone [Streptosporangium nondiastaticum]|uniref:Pyrrolo-quinoline quinone n=1 Tax=Streptosporangium nondiastaticum TaxID=35764 RepID=A0A9X7JSM2_9ACTN|nr:pyrrolo-quinoline quinone [Streptosporangium nondiastaticum]PSJ29145.1 pyrrolo-quinoline quinone [Streptosporangium nondiastaticum]
MPAIADGAGPAPVTTQHNDNRRTGANLHEHALTPLTVGPTTFGKLFTRAVDGQIYAQPLVVPGVDVPGTGPRDIVYAATMHNSVYAFDAHDPAATAPLWRASLGPSAPLPDPQIGPSGYRDIAVEVGIVSTPVIDTARQVLYAVAFTKDADGHHHTLHALDLATGQEALGGPVRIAAEVPGTGEGSSGGRLAFVSKRHIQRAALTLANGRVYIAFAAYGDRRPYHGWVLAHDAETLALRGAYVATPGTRMGGIWQAGQGLAVDDRGCLYFMTGNGGFAADGSELGDSIVKLTPDLALADWFSPYNNAALDARDIDLGSAGPLLLPGTSLLLGGGKEGKFYLLDTTDMGHFHAGSDSQIPQSFSVVPPDGNRHHIHGGPVYGDFPFPDGPWAYVWPENAFLSAYRFDGRRFATTPVSTSTTTDPAGVPGGSPGMPGGMLSLSAHHTDPATGLLWASHPYRDDANQAVVEGILRCYQADDLTRELWNSKTNAPRDDVGLFAKFVPPTVTGGKVYAATFSGALHVYGLLARP